MKTIILAVSLLAITTNLYAKPPKVSGNYEQGSRYALEIGEDDYFIFDLTEVDDVDDQESWAYNFNKGYLQVSQTVNDKLRYVVKYDYLDKDFFAASSDATNNKNRLNYYRTYSWMKLPSNLKLKLEYYIRVQEYTYRTWDNLTHVPHMLLQWSPAKGRQANLSVRYKAQRYDESTETWKDKNQVDSYIGYKEKINDSLTLNAKYKYTFRQYEDNPNETNAVRKSFSAGFDYQF